MADRGTILPFSARAAVAAFTPDRLTELSLRYDAALMPCDPTKLAARLRALWESTTAPGNMTAKSWLHEGNRLLRDLPLAIAYRAIDRAVLDSTRGFTPSVAAIRAHADPMLSEMRRHATRLHAVKRAAETPEPTETADHPHAGAIADHETTSEILQRVWPGMGQHDTGPRAPKSEADPDRPCRAPTREDYLRMGVTPEVLDRIAAPPPADEQRDAA
ncbi:hypothetical protein KZ810_08065 [Sphingomonas sp. RHCKR47]|uniref:hypothetical protein n=1 Tax=Sphingomonas citricola TaxID=2862498 RepID=UPI001CA58BA7|nr:hypothetical protein [Sphingomonas citricola]MBW6523452.1 hypothetical protein [Sphingomonas citricola]